MSGGHTDWEWECWGATDPYFAVLTQGKYHAAALTPERREEFFESGRAYVAHLFDAIRSRRDPDFAPKRVLEFGCGVGRLVIPLAAVCDTVVAVDVAPSMLAEARANCAARAVRNIEFHLSDDSVAGFGGNYDLIHSYTVFQHIPVARGEGIFARLLARLADGGVGVLHFMYQTPYRTRKLGIFVRKCGFWGKQLINVSRGRGFFSLGMQMNPYDLNRTMAALQQNGVRDFYAEFTDDGGYLGVILFFKKRTRPERMTIASGDHAEANENIAARKEVTSS
ncbi:MAG TPA: class I SAM-dependent methyltransferase [Candidatus Binatia bacterium]